MHPEQRLSIPIGPESVSKTQLLSYVEVRDADMAVTAANAVKVWITLVMAGRFGLLMCLVAHRNLWIRARALGFVSIFMMMFSRVVPMAFVIRSIHARIQHVILNQLDWCLDSFCW